jgi:hypothetical protein
MAGGQGPVAGEEQAAGLGRAGSPAGVDGGRAARQPPTGLVEVAGVVLEEDDEQ